MIQLLVNIDVDDLERGIRFYTDAFGLQVGRRMGPEFVELLGAAAPIYLLRKSGTTAAVPDQATARDYRRHWTPVHLDFAVDDLEAAVARAEAAGATREGAISEHAWGRMALLADPFGHGVDLLQFHGRGYDEIVSDD